MVLLLIFVVSVSVTIHPIFVHIIFGLFKVAELPPFEKKLFPRLIIFTVCNFSNFPLWLCMCIT